MKKLNGFICVLILFIKIEMTNQKNSNTKSNINLNSGKDPIKESEMKIITDKIFKYANSRIPLSLSIPLSQNITNYTVIELIDNKGYKLFCKNHCSFRGYCLDGICYCKQGFIGDDCSKLSYPVYCLNNCTNNGICNDEGLCVCNEGFIGVDCSISK
jgi:hypothetical protein